MQASVYAADSDVRCFRRFFGWASGDGDEMDDNPAKRLRQPKFAEPPVRVAAEDEMEKMIAVCERDKLGRRDAAMIAVLYSGPRLGELCVVDLPHLDLEEGWMTVPKTKSGRLGGFHFTEGDRAHRSVPASARHRGSGAAFPVSDGQAPEVERCRTDGSTPHLLRRAWSSPATIGD